MCIVIAVAWLRGKPPLTMDHNLLFFQNLLFQHWLKVEHENETQDQMRLAAAALIISSNEDHAWAIEDRRPRRQYLGCPNLLPNPRFGTPWKPLYEHHEDRTFITTMGVDTSTFRVILEASFGGLWYLHAIPRTDTHTAGHGRAGRRSLDAEVDLVSCFTGFHRPCARSASSRYLPLFCQLFQDT